MSDEPFFGGVVPAKVRWFCPTYYVGILIGLVPVLLIVSCRVLYALFVALFNGIKDAFVAVLGDPP